MARFVVHVHKELRDQRAVLIAVFAALPVLTLLAFWGLTEHLVEADVDQAAALVVPIALALYLLAMAGDVFAGESRRDTLALLRRQPGGLGYAFGAKVAVTAVGLVAVFLWQSFLLQAAWSLWGRVQVMAEFRALLVFGLRSPFTIGAVLLASWMLLTSTWLKQGGIALLLAPMLAAAVALPAFLWGQAHPLLARFVVHEFEEAQPWLFALAALLPLLAAAWSWLGGRRVVRSAWSAAWRGLVAVALLSGVAYGGTAMWIGARLELTPESSDLRIEIGLASDDGSRLYLTVQGDAHRAPDDYQAENRTPKRTWVVDTKTGAWNTLGDWADVVSGPPLRGFYYHGGWEGSALAPLPKVVQYRKNPDGKRPFAVWIDARTGDTLKVVPADVRTEDVARWIDEAGRATSWVRDEQGRRAWREGRIWEMSRVGEDGAVETVRTADSFQAHRSIPGGWYGWDGKGKHVVFDATSTETYRVDFDRHRFVIGPRLVLESRKVPNEGRYERVLIDPKTGLETPARGAPEGHVGLLAAVDRTTVLCRSSEKPHGLWLWNPVEGTRKVLTPPEVSVEDIWQQGRDAEGRLGLVLGRGDSWDVAVLDPQTAELTVRGRGRAHRPWLIALFPDGTLYGIEDGKRVFLYGPGPDDVELIFPR